MTQIVTVLADQYIKTLLSAVNKWASPGSCKAKFYFLQGMGNFFFFKAVVLSNAILETYIIFQRTLVIKLRKQSYTYNYLIAAEKQIYLPVKETLIPLQNSCRYFTIT